VKRGGGRGKGERGEEGEVSFAFQTIIFITLRSVGRHRKGRKEEGKDLSSLLLLSKRVAAGVGERGEKGDRT